MADQIFNTIINCRYTMTKLKITFENFPNSSIDFLENLVDDYDYEGGFDPESFETTNNAEKFIVDITSNKEFSIDNDDLDDNLLDVLVDRGIFLVTYTSHLMTWMLTRQR